MRYRVCKVSPTIKRRPRYWGYYPHYWWNWYYPPRPVTNIIGSQFQDAQQEMINTGIMTDNTQTQILSQIGRLQPLK
jgi:hypothetical protein